MYSCSTPTDYWGNHSCQILCFYMSFFGLSEFCPIKSRWARGQFAQKSVWQLLVLRGRSGIWKTGMCAGLKSLKHLDVAWNTNPNQIYNLSPGHFICIIFATSQDTAKIPDSWTGRRHTPSSETIWQFLYLQVFSFCSFNSWWLSDVLSQKPKAWITATGSTPACRSPAPTATPASASTGSVRSSTTWPPAGQSLLRSRLKQQTHRMMHVFNVLDT